MPHVALVRIAAWSRESDADWITEPARTMLTFQTVDGPCVSDPLDMAHSGDRTIIMNRRMMHQWQHGEGAGCGFMLTCQLGPTQTVHRALCRPRNDAVNPHQMRSNLRNRPKTGWFMRRGLGSPSKTADTVGTDFGGGANAPRTPGHVMHGNETDHAHSDV